MNTTPSDIFAIEHLPTGDSEVCSTVKSLLLEVSSDTTPASVNPHLTSVSPALNTDEWSEWLKVKERLAIAIKEIVEKNEASFAFPSQSIYVEKK